jgi:hypothetical protein
MLKPHEAGGMAVDWRKNFGLLGGGRKAGATGIGRELGIVRR